MYSACSKTHTCTWQIWSIASARTHTHSVFHSSQYPSHSLSSFPEGRCNISLGTAYFYYLASWWQPAGVREIEIDMRADSVAHIPPQSVRILSHVSLSLSVHVCVIYSVFLSNLKWQAMKSTVICVERGHIQHSLVYKRWQHHSYTGLDNSNIQTLILSCHFWSFCANVCLIWVKHDTSYSVIYL